MKKKIYSWVDIYLQGWYLFIFYFYFESKWCCFPWLRILQEQKKKLCTRMNIHFKLCMYIEFSFFFLLFLKGVEKYTF